MVVVVLLASTHPVFADSYEKTQTISQVNECGNYWFPVNIICSNLSSKLRVMRMMLDWRLQLQIAKVLILARIMAPHFRRSFICLTMLTRAMILILL